MNAILSITLPHLGLIERMPSEQYFSIEALNNSGMTNLLERSPWHYKMSFAEDAVRHAVSPSLQMFNGTLTHCASLEPLEFPKRYVVGPDVDKRTKLWKQFREDWPEHEVIDQLQYDSAWAQANAVRKIPLIDDILSSGKSEVSVFWNELVESAGKTIEVLCKARIDWVHMVGTSDAPAAILLDLKTTGNASQAAFERSIATFSYHRQCMWYSRGFTAATGIPVVGFVFALVESSYPYAATPCMLDDEAMTRGAAECGNALRLVAQCQQRNEWPSYPQDIQIFSLPPWKLKEPA